MVLCPLICLVASDHKLLSAYSSVVHMGFFYLAFLTSSMYAASGSLLIVLGHGYVSALLFWLVGELYSSVGVRVIYHSAGLWAGSFLLGSLSLLILLFNSGIPPSARFVGEVLGLSVLFMSCSGYFVYLFVYYVVGLAYSILLFVGLASGRASYSCIPSSLTRALPILILSVIGTWLCL